jgi:hypothetical protein
MGLGQVLTGIPSHYVYTCFRFSPFPTKSKFGTLIFQIKNPGGNKSTWLIVCHAR